MAEKKINAVVKLQLPAGKATAGPPVGSSLGPHGINIPAFTKEFNERTASEAGLIIPVVITIFADRSFTFVTKTPPAAVLIKKACKLDKGSGNPLRDKVAKLSQKDLEEIAKTKMPDISANDIEAAKKIIAGTARSMGVEVEA